MVHAKKVLETSNDTHAICADGNIATSRWKNSFLMKTKKDQVKIAALRRNLEDVQVGQERP